MFDDEQTVTQQTEEDVMMTKVSTLMDRLYQNQEIQKLADQHGIDAKNSVQLTDDAVKNVAVSVVSLLLAKRSEDPRYTKLVKTGVEKRSMKAELINSYKDEAISLIDKYHKSK